MFEGKKWQLVELFQDSVEYIFEFLISVPTLSLNFESRITLNL